MHLWDITLIFARDTPAPKGSGSGRTGTLTVRQAFELTRPRESAGSLVSAAASRRIQTTGCSVQRLSQVPGSPWLGSRRLAQPEPALPRTRQLAFPGSVPTPLEPCSGEVANRLISKALPSSVYSGSEPPGFVEEGIFPTERGGELLLIVRGLQAIARLASSMARHLTRMAARKDGWLPWGRFA